MTFAVDAMAQAATPPVEGFNWIPMVIEFLRNIPTVGPILETIFSVIAIVASVATALTASFMVVLKIPQLVAIWTDAPKALEYLKKFENKVLPWLAYLSIFNVQKEKK